LFRAARDECLLAIEVEEMALSDWPEPFTPEDSAADFGWEDFWT